MFYFQRLLNQGLAGIDGTQIIPTVVGIAYAILLVGFLIGLYQAAMRGGDVQALGMTAIKYIVVGIILANWSTVFHGVNDAFTQVAQSIDSSFGAGDLFMDWFGQLKQQFDTNIGQTILSLITGAQAAAITVLLLILAYVFYALAFVVFAFFYALYGSVLYVVGPMVLALMPMNGANQLAKSHATNLMTWNAWGILYAIFAVLITAVQGNLVNNQVDHAGFLGFFTGSFDALLLGLISIFYALAMLLIPLIAKKIIAGDVGSSAYSLVRTAAVAVGAAVSAGAGFAAGAGGSGATGAGASAGGTGATTAGGVTGAGSTPPPEPSMADTIRQGVKSADEGTAPRSSGDSTQESSGTRS